MVLVESRQVWAQAERAVWAESGQQVALAPVVLVGYQELLRKSLALVKVELPVEKEVALWVVVESEE